jgi:hypothetical protein
VRRQKEERLWDLLVKINATIVTDLVIGLQSVEDLLLEEIEIIDLNLPSLMKEEIEIEILIEEIGIEIMTEEIEIGIGIENLIEETENQLEMIEEIEILIEIQESMKEEIEGMIEERENLKENLIDIENLKEENLIEMYLEMKIEINLEIDLL